MERARTTIQVREVLEVGQAVALLTSGEPRAAQEAEASTMGLDCKAAPAALRHTEEGEAPAGYFIPHSGRQPGKMVQVLVVVVVARVGPRRAIRAALAASGGILAFLAVAEAAEAGTRRIHFLPASSA